jgi:hypothetical protein
MSLVAKLSVVSIACVSSALVACGGQPTPSSTGAGETGSTASALDAPNGGIDTTSTESQAFGDKAVEALPVMDDSLAATIDPTDPTTALAAAGGNAYRIALVWGHLPAPHDADPTSIAPQLENWTGSVSVAAGAIGLKRTIAFDLNDHVDARTSAASLSFTSHTLPYVDGLLLRVVVPAGATPTLHFATDALTTDIDLSKLGADVGGVQRLANQVEGLSWIGFPEDGCARGFVHGRWIKEEPSFGRLVGVVSDGDGERIGYARGLWGHAPKRDANVWFAKLIDLGGQPTGLSFGTYDAGEYDGHWAAEDDMHLDVGGTTGFYSDGYEVGDGRGVWIGRWSAKCPAASAPDAG